MKPTDEMNNIIFDAFAEFRIHPVRIDVGLIRFSRDECHNSGLPSLMEWDILDKLNEIIKEVTGDKYYTCSSGKDDDYWYWEINKRGEK